MALVTERQKIQHLLRRAGFGYRADELEMYVNLGLENTIEQLLNPEKVDDSKCEALLKDFADTQTDKFKTNVRYRTALWHIRLAHSERPLLEKMTYFWHNHFATSMTKVSQPEFMAIQNQTLRNNALGLFPNLLQAITNDPAMMVYLDNRLNVKGAPNENYAREVMELFTMGESSGYSESDVIEAARALTGWTVNRGKNRATAALLEHDPNSLIRFRRSKHDSAQKTLLGVSGNLNAESVAAILSSQTETADFLGTRLWEWFALKNPEPQLIAKTTDAYFKSNGSIKEMVRTILTSKEMYSERAYRLRIKSPVEYVLGSIRNISGITNGKAEMSDTLSMGQQLFFPPSVAGWPGGTDWINSNTILTRTNFANELTRTYPRNRKNRTFNIPELVKEMAVINDVEKVVDFTLDLLVGGDVDEATREILIEHLGGRYHYNYDESVKNGTLNGMFYLALTMPLYQLA